MWTQSSISLGTSGSASAATPTLKSRSAPAVASPPGRAPATDTKTPASLRSSKTSGVSSGSLERSPAATDAQHAPHPVADEIFQLWTRPDGVDTETPTKNHTWFYFSLEFTPNPAKLKNQASQSQIHYKSQLPSWSKSSSPRGVVPPPSLASSVSPSAIPVLSRISQIPRPGSAAGVPPIRVSNPTMYKSSSPLTKSTSIDGIASLADTKDTDTITIELRLMNLNRVRKLFAMGMRPVYRNATDTVWRRVPTTPITRLTSDGFLRMHFLFTFAKSTSVSAQSCQSLSSVAKLGSRNDPAPPGTYYFAYCVPYSYTDLQTRIKHLVGLYAPSDVSDTVSSVTDSAIAINSDDDCGIQTDGVTTAVASPKADSSASKDTSTQSIETRIKQRAGKEGSIPRLTKTRKSATKSNATKPDESPSRQSSISKPIGSKNIYLHHDVLVHSVDGHHLDLLTISSTDGMLPFRESAIDGLFPDRSPDRRSRAFQMAPLHHDTSNQPPPTSKHISKPGVLGLQNETKISAGKHYAFLSARIHPGETISSFMLDGAIDFLLSEDPRARLLRSLFVFKIVPMLNPDGVVRGHYRGDRRGVNLNRVYVDPDMTTHPTVWATKRYITHVLATSGPVRWYIDFHGHANKWGCFLFGNWIDDVERQISMLAFARCMHMNCGVFDFSECDFAPKGMIHSSMVNSGQGHDEGTGSDTLHTDVNNDGDQTSSATSMRNSTITTGGYAGSANVSVEATKDGTGRVAIYRALGIHHCYTFEANYYGCKSERRAVAKCAIDPSLDIRNTPSMNASLTTSTSPLVSPATQPSNVSATASHHSLASRLPSVESRRFTLADMRGMGRSLAVSILDMEMPMHPWSRLHVAEPLGITSVQNWAIDRLRRVYDKVGKPVQDDHVALFLRRREATAMNAADTGVAAIVSPPPSRSNITASSKSKIARL